MYRPRGIKKEIRKAIIISKKIKGGLMKEGIPGLIEYLEDPEDKKVLSYKFFFEAMDRNEMRIEIKDKIISDLKKKTKLITEKLKLITEETELMIEEIGL